MNQDSALKRDQIEIMIKRMHAELSNVIKTPLVKLSQWVN